MKNFFVYSLPGSNEIICGGSDKLLYGLHENSFIIAPFDQSASPYFSIPFDKSFDFNDLNGMMENTELYLKYFHFPNATTDKLTHGQEVDEIIRSFGKDPDKKIIAARVILGKDKIDFVKTFQFFREKRTNSFTFLFYTPETGCWFGASPELLAESTNNVIHTVALAGTRTVNDPEDWSTKNIEEQKIVKDYILDIMHKHHFNASCGKLRTKNAGNVEHLLSEIEAPLLSTTDKNKIEYFLKDLSPTPALCGFPKDESLSKIKILEDFDRALYGGFCGPYTDSSHFVFHVILRTFWIIPQRWCLFVGGGITHKSDPEEEWTETENKADSVIKLLKFCHKKN